MSEIRTPPSLKWLITKRARLLGELSRLEQVKLKSLPALRDELARTEELAANLKTTLASKEEVVTRTESVIRQELQAVEITLCMHEVQLNLDSLPAIRTHESVRMLPYGMVTRLALRCLGEARGKSLTTTEIAVYVAREGRLILDDEEFRDFRSHVRKRLQGMYYAATIVRLDRPKTSVEGRWCISTLTAFSSSPIETIQSPRDDESLASSLATSETSQP